VWTAAEELGASESLAAFSRALISADFRPSAEIWLDSGFVSPGHTTPNARSQEMRAASDFFAELIVSSASNPDGKDQEL
jgi:hypothetical protein